MKSMYGKKICYSRAEDWDYEEVIEWRAKTESDGTCKGGDVLCGGDKSSSTKYCADKLIYKENGSMCPVNSFKYSDKDITSFVKITNEPDSNEGEASDSNTRNLQSSWTRDDPYSEGSTTY